MWISNRSLLWTTATPTRLESVNSPLPREGGGSGWGQHAADILDVLDTLGLTRATITGHSLGATIAVHLSRLAPDRVERLILLDPALALPPPLAEHLTPGPDGRRRWRHTAPMVCATYRELTGPALIPPPGTRTTLVVARRSKAVPPGYADRCRATLHDFNLADIDCGHQIPPERPAEAAALIRPQASAR